MLVLAYPYLGSPDVHPSGLVRSSVVNRTSVRHTAVTGIAMEQGHLSIANTGTSRPR